MDYSDCYDFNQRLLEKRRQRYNQRKRNRTSASTTPSDEKKIESKQERPRRDDSDDEDGSRTGDGRLKRSRIYHYDDDRNEKHFECSPNAPKAETATSRQKRPVKHSVRDEEKMAELKAC